MVAIFVHLDDTNAENGGLIIWPKSHKNVPQFDQGASDRTGYHYLKSSEFPFESGQSVSANAGDAVMFSYLTVHASYPNRSDRDRRMILIQAVSADDKPLSMIHRHSKGQGIVLRGINPNLKQSSHYKRKAKELEVIEQELKQEKTDHHELSIANDCTKENDFGIFCNIMYNLMNVYHFHHCNNLINVYGCARMLPTKMNKFHK